MSDVSNPEFNFKPEPLKNPRNFLQETLKNKELKPPAASPNLSEQFPKRYDLQIPGYKKVEIQNAKERNPFEPPQYPKQKINFEGGLTTEFNVANRIWAIGESGNAGHCYFITPEGDILRAVATKPQDNEFGSREWKLSNFKILKLNQLMVPESLKGLADGKIPWQIEDENKEGLQAFQKILEETQDKPVAKDHLLETANTTLPSRESLQVPTQQAQTEDRRKAHYLDMNLNGALKTIPSQGVMLDVGCNTGGVGVEIAKRLQLKLVQADIKADPRDRELQSIPYVQLPTSEPPKFDKPMIDLMFLSDVIQHVPKTPYKKPDGQFMTPDETITAFLEGLSTGLTSEGKILLTGLKMQNNGQYLLRENKLQKIIEDSPTLKSKVIISF